MMNKQSRNQIADDATDDLTLNDIFNRDAIRRALFEHGLTKNPGDYVRLVETRLRNLGWEIYAGEVKDQDAYMLFWLSPECSKATAATYCAERNVNVNRLFIYSGNMGLVQLSCGCRVRPRTSSENLDVARIPRVWSTPSDNEPEPEKIPMPERLENPTPAQAACQDLQDYFLHWRDWVREQYS